MRKLRAGATQPDASAAQINCVNPLHRKGKEDREAKIIRVAPRLFDIEKIEQMLNIVIQVLANHHVERVLGFDAYTNGYPSCTDDYYSTRYAAQQLIFAIAISQHPLLAGLAESDKRLYKKFLMEKTRQANEKMDGRNPKWDAESDAKEALAQEMVDAKILSGFRILDLGCGCSPGFAGCTRALGAEVFTVDVISAQDFVFREREGFIGEKERETEINNHIQIDLRASDALETIIQRTGGNFDLVTHAILAYVPYHAYDSADSPSLGKLCKIVLSLLRPGGLYFRSDFGYDFGALAVKDEKSEKWGNNYRVERYFDDSLHLKFKLFEVKAPFDLNNEMKISLERGV